MIDIKPQKITTAADHHLGTGENLFSSDYRPRDDPTTWDLHQSLNSNETVSLTKADRITSEEDQESLWEICLGMVCIKHPFLPNLDSLLMDLDIGS
jgi:hypothetical protein